MIVWNHVNTHFHCRSRIWNYAIRIERDYRRSWMPFWSPFTSGNSVKLRWIPRTWSMATMLLYTGVIKKNPSNHIFIEFYGKFHIFITICHFCYYSPSKCMITLQFWSNFFISRLPEESQNTNNLTIYLKNIKNHGQNYWKMLKNQNWITTKHAKNTVFCPFKLDMLLLKPICRQIRYVRFC